MGDHADDAMIEAYRHEIELEAQEEPARNLLLAYNSTGIAEWKQKNGVKILVSNMDDDHVRNSYNMLKRNEGFCGPISLAWITILSLELKKRRK